eukprot:jgi/Chrzof1/6823/UNPLg00892.t1
MDTPVPIPDAQSDPPVVTAVAPLVVPLVNSPTVTLAQEAFFDAVEAFPADVNPTPGDTPFRWPQLCLHHILPMMFLLAVAWVTPHPCVLGYYGLWCCWYYSPKRNPGVDQAVAKALCYGWWLPLSCCQLLLSVYRWLCSWCYWLFQPVWQPLLYVCRGAQLPPQSPVRHARKQIYRIISKGNHGRTKNASQKHRLGVGKDAVPVPSCIRTHVLLRALLCTLLLALPVIAATMPATLPFASTVVAATAALGGGVLSLSTAAEAHHPLKTSPSTPCQHNTTVSATMAPVVAIQQPMPTLPSR